MKKVIMAAATLLAAVSANAQMSVHDVYIDVSNLNPGSKESINTNRSRVSISRSGVSESGSALIATVDVGPADVLRVRGSASGTYGTISAGQGANSAEAAISGDLGQVALVTYDRSLISRTVSTSLKGVVRYDTVQYGNHSGSASTDGSANYVYRTRDYGVSLSTGKSHLSGKQVMHVGGVYHLGATTIAAGANNDTTRARDITIAHRTGNWNFSYTHVSFADRKHNIVGVGRMIDSRTELYAGADVSASSGNPEQPKLVAGFRYNF